MVLVECQKYGVECDIIFNSKKSAIMFFRPDYMQNSNLPVFKMNEENIEVAKHVNNTVCMKYGESFATIV